MKQYQMKDFTAFIYSTLAEENLVEPIGINKAKIHEMDSKYKSWLFLISVILPATLHEACHIHLQINKKFQASI